MSKNVINFENLEKIEDMLKILLLIKKDTSNHFEKRWLTTKELERYIGYKERTIKKFIEDGELVNGKHFYKKGRKNLFDRLEIDNWIINDNEIDSNELARALAQDFAA